MAAKPLQNDSAEYLRSAQAHLICRIDSQGDLGRKVTPYVREYELGWQEVMSEGYDPDHSPLGCPVYWRIVNRGDEQFYCSTFLATRDQVIKAWGTEGLRYCDAFTGMAVAQAETNLAGEWPPDALREAEEVAAYRRASKTATPEERESFAIAAGYTPLEYEIRGEGFSMRELMQALKTLEAHIGQLPEDLLTACFERYASRWLKQKLPISNMPQLIALYRRERAMKSEERARAILRAFGVRLLDADKPDDVQKWKKVSGGREH
jgi:hypothetical protein